MSRKKRSNNASGKKRGHYQQKRALRTDSRNTLNLSEETEPGDESEARYQNQTTQSRKADAKKNGYKSVLTEDDTPTGNILPGMRTDFQFERTGSAKAEEEEEADSHEARKRRSRRRARRKADAKRQGVSSEQSEQDKSDIRASPGAPSENSGVKAAYAAGQVHAAELHNRNKAEQQRSERQQAERQRSEQQRLERQSSDQRRLEQQRLERQRADRYRSERYGTEKEPKYQNQTSAFNVISDDNPELFGIGEDTSPVPEIGKGIAGTDFRRGLDNDIRFGTHEDREKRKNSLFNTEFEMKRSYSREREQAQKEVQEPKKRRRRRSEKLNYDKRREEEHRSRGYEDKSEYTAFNAESIYQPNIPDKNKINNIDTGKSDSSAAPNPNKRASEELQRRERISRRESDTRWSADRSGENQPERNTDIQFGVHEEKSKGARKGTMNTEFEMKRSSSAKDMQLDAQKLEIQQAVDKRKSRSRRASRNRSGTDGAVSEKEQYNAFNQPDTYDDKSRLIADAREDDVQFGRKAGRDTKFSRTTEHDTEFSHSADGDVEFSRSADGDMEFSHSAKGDTEFSHSGKRDIEFSHTAEKDEQFKIKRSDADFKLKRKRGSGSEKTVGSEEKTDYPGNRTDVPLTKKAVQKGDGKSEQAFNVLSDEAAAKKEWEFLAGKSTEYLFKRGADSDIRFGAHKRADDMFKSHRKEFELKYVRNEKDIRFVRSNGEVEFKYNSPSAQTEGISGKSKLSFKRGRLKQDEFKFSEKGASESRAFHDTDSTGSSGSADRSKGTFGARSEARSEYQTEEQRKYKLNFGDIKVSADTAAAAEHAAGAVSAAAAASGYTENGEEQGSGAETVERMAFRLKRDIHFERQRKKFQKALREEHEDKNKNKSRDKKDEKSSDQKQQDTENKPEAEKSGEAQNGEGSKRYNYKSDYEYTYRAETKRSSGQERSRQSSQQSRQEHSQSSSRQGPNVDSDTSTNRFHSERIKEAEAKAKKAEAKADKAEEKARKLQEKQQRHNKLRFGGVPGMIMHQAAGEVEEAVKNKLREHDDNVGLDVEDKIVEYTGEAVKAAYRYHKNKPYRMLRKAKRLRRRANRANNRLNFEKEQAKKAAEQAAKEGASRAGEAAGAAAKKKAEKEAQRHFYRKIAQSRLYKRAYQYALFRKGTSVVKNAALKIADSVKNAIHAVVSLLSSKVKLIAAAVAAGVVALMMCAALFLLLITSIAGGYIEENVTTSAELEAFGTYWISMEDELGGYPLDDDYPDNYYVYYYGQEYIGMDMPKLMAYYNAVNGKSVYDTDSMLSIEGLFDTIYTWETSEIVYNEGSEDEFHEIYADLIIADLDELIDELTDEEKELYKACYEIYTEDEEYSEIWDGL